MKSMSYKLMDKNVINLQKNDFINDTNYYIMQQDTQEKKRLLHFALMKFIKTQYNKKNDILIRNSKTKNFFSKYNNLNLLPYLKKKIYKKQVEKNSYFSIDSKTSQISENKSYFPKTKNIDGYISKRDTFYSQPKINKSKENKDKNRNKKGQKNRIQSSFESVSTKYRNFLEHTSSDKTKLFNNKVELNEEMLRYSKRMIYLMQNSNFKKYNYNISSFKRKNSSKSHIFEYNNEDDFNNEKTNFDTPQKESSLNNKIQLNSFTNGKKNKIIFNYMNDKSNNAELFLQDIPFGKTLNKFNFQYDGKNKGNSLKKNLTYREDKKDSKIIFLNQDKTDSNNIINFNFNNDEKNKIINYIKSFYENKKLSPTEIKYRASNEIKNLNIKRCNLSQRKKDFNLFFHDKNDKFEFINPKEGSKSITSDKRSLTNDQKIELNDKFRITMKIEKFNKNNNKFTPNCLISFNRDFNNRKNKNNDIIDLI